MELTLPLEFSAQLTTVKKPKYLSSKSGLGTIPARFVCQKISFYYHNTFDYCNVPKKLHNSKRYEKGMIHVTTEMLQKMTNKLSEETTIANENEQNFRLSLHCSVLCLILMAQGACRKIFLKNKMFWKLKKDIVRFLQSRRSWTPKC